MNKSTYEQQIQDTKRGHKRFIDAVRRKHKLYTKKPAKSDERIQFNRKPPRHDTTIEHLIKYYKLFSPSTPDVPIKTNCLYLPSIFSLTHAPESSFAFLRNLFHVLHQANQPLLVISYKRCKQIDLDASVCMDVMLTRFLKHYRYLRRIRPDLKRIRIIQGIEASPDVLKFLHCTGTGQVIQGLQAKFPDIISSPLRIAYKSPHRKGVKEVTTTALVKHLQLCLSRFDKKLHAKDRERFSDIIGEVIANAEDHSSLPYNYSIGHFNETKEQGEHFGRFQCVIFNFGKTIYERLKDPNDCKNKSILPEMERLSKRYTAKRWFGLKEAPFEEETLWTLYALQDGVSSVAPHRGNGTIQFIRDFLELRSGEPNKRSVLTLISGHTRIQLDGSHHLQQKINEDGESHTVITFNASGSLEEKPDEKFVTFATQYFPGTLLYADVYLTVDHLNPQ